MSYTDLVVPALTFNKEGMKRVGTDSAYTVIAYIIIIVYDLLTTITLTLKQEIPFSSGLSGSGLTGAGLFISLLLNALIHDLVQIYLIMIVAKYLFKSTLDFNAVLRYFAAVMIWNYIPYLISLFVPLSFFVFLFFFLFNIAFMIGLTTYDSDGFAMWKSFLSIVLGFGLMVAVNHIVMNYILVPIFT